MYLRFFVLFLVLTFALDASIAQTIKKDSTTTHPTKSDSIIKEIKVFSQRNNIFSKLLRNFIVVERKTKTTINKQFSNKTYNQFEGKIIRHINITVLDVFGPSINNPNKVARSRVEKAGNSLHKTTLNWVIKQRLLFKSGERLEPLKISESERLLRQYKNTYDARIYIENLKNKGDSIDVTVVAQDVWSITGGGAFDPASIRGDLSLRDVNFVGFGNELSGKVLYNKKDSIPWHYTMEFINYNIAHTFLVGSIYYKNLPAALNYGIGINREFFSPSIKWAGGASFNWLEDKRLIYDIDSTIVSKGFNNNQQDFWLGYATNFYKRPENNFFSAVRLLRTDFTKNPSEDTFRISFQSNTLLLGSIGYSYRRFIKESYIFGLGRTEDIPIGEIYTATFGMENGQYIQRPYLGLLAGYSHYFNNIGYLSGSVEWGALRNGKKWQDAVLSTEVLFYTKLIPIGNWMLRSFFWNRITYGYNTVPGKILNINSKDGIRGFSAGSLIGNKKFVINYENVFFTPYNLLGFKMAFTIFGDFAFIGKNSQPLFQSNFYQAYGFGFRFRNEHLIFRTIQLTFAYYPGVKNLNEQTFKFFEESRSFYQFKNFQFSRPQKVEF